MEKSKGYVSERELREGLIKLDNALDKFILMAIYNRIVGKSGMSDLINLKKKDVDFKNHFIKVGKWQVPMDKNFEKITKEAIEQEYYYLEVNSSYVAEGYNLNNDSEYVLRTRPKSRNKNGTAPLNYDGLRNKVRGLCAKAGLELNVSQLETSGIINKMLKKKSDWTVLDVELWLRINNIKVNAYRIYTIIKDING